LVCSWLAVEEDVDEGGDDLGGERLFVGDDVGAPQSGAPGHNQQHILLFGGPKRLISQRRGSDRSFDCRPDITSGKQNPARRVGRFGQDFK